MWMSGSMCPEKPRCPKPLAMASSTTSSGVSDPSHITVWVW